MSAALVPTGTGAIFISMERSVHLEPQTKTNPCASAAGGDAGDLCVISRRRYR